MITNDKCYQSGCYFDMPCHPPCGGPCGCGPMCPPSGFCTSPGCCPPSPCGPLGCGYLNLQIPIGLLLLAGGFLIGQNCGQKTPL